MAFHPPPPSFELHTPSEPQWFPRPITDTIESSLDLLERVEEDRRRRLRSIANVSARVPIGLGGTEDRGNAGATSGANVSPKPPSNLSNRPGHYGRYRYYPPPDETPPDESISLHRSYQLEASFSSSLVTGRSPERRKNYSNTTSAGRYRSAAAAGSSSSSSSVRNRSRSTSHSPHQRRNRDLHTPTDGIGTTTATGAPPAVHMDQDSTSNNSDSGSSIEGGRFLDSFNVSTSAVLFLSPPFDPRAGGGGGVRRHTTPRGGGSRRSSIGSSTSFSSSHLYQQSSSMVDWSMSTPHNAASSQQQQQQLQVDTAIQPAASSSVDVSAMVDDADLITPPANMTTTTTDAASAQHGHGADVYSQRSVRRSQRQRRRRRDWE